METFIPSNLAEALGWTILHSFWQASIIGAVLWLILQVVRNTNAVQRYYFSLSALFAVLLVAVVTFFTIYQPDNQHLALALTEEANWVVLPAFFADEKTWADYLDIGINLASAYSPQISLVWLLGVVFLSIRFIINLLYIHQLKTYKTKPASMEWEARLKAIAEKVKTNRQIKLIESALVAVPTVVGWLKPVILFPLGMFASLPPHEIESILAHELAHIRRNDFITNILQSMIEILFFYHPAVWFIAKHIENERENCCDDIAVAAIGNSLTYIKALTNLATMKMNNLTPALAITGKNGGLLQRISRIARNTNLVNNWARKNTISPKLAAAMILIMSLLLLITKTEASTILDALAKPFEKQESVKENTPKEFKNNELAINDTSKKAKKQITININDPQKVKQITLTADSIFFHDTTQGKSFLFYTKENSLGKGLDSLNTKPQFYFISNDSSNNKSNYLKVRTEIRADSLSKNPNTSIIINNDNYTVLRPKYLTDNTPLYIIDGEEVPQGKDASVEILKKINPNDIAAIEVMKGEKAFKKYGEKGKNGVIIITTKNQKKKTTSLQKSEMLYILDEEEVSKERIESPEILKNTVTINIIGKDQAVKIYGDKGKNGAMVIYTTKTKQHPKPEDIAKGIRVTELEPLDKNTEVLVYPNPSQQAVNIRFMLEKEMPVWIEVHDTKGQKVATIANGSYLNKGQNSFLWDTQNVPAGAYIISLKQGTSLSQHKIIVE